MYSSVELLNGTGFRVPFHAVTLCPLLYSSFLGSQTSDAPDRHLNADFLERLTSLCVTFTRASVRSDKVLQVYGSFPFCVTSFDPLMDILF